MNSFRLILNVCAFLVISPVAIADLPLTVEELITDKGKLKLDMSLAYLNSEQKGLQTGVPIVIQTGENSFVTLPTQIGEFDGNTDILVSTLGLRYGVTLSAEVYTRNSYLSRRSRVISLSGKNEDSENKFVESWLGLNYQFSQDNDTPALLGFIEAAVFEKRIYEASYGKSWLLGFTVYRAIDPVVLSFTTTYRLNQEVDDREITIKPGNFLSINISTAFAVNDRVTLSTGIKWLNRQPDINDDISQGIRITSTSLILGLGYGVANGNTLNLSFKTDVSGQNGADLRFNWLYAF